MSSGRRSRGETRRSWQWVPRWRHWRSSTRTTRDTSRCWRSPFVQRRSTTTCCRLMWVQNGASCSVCGCKGTEGLWYVRTESDCKGTEGLWYVRTESDCKGTEGLWYVRTKSYCKGTESLLCVLHELHYSHRPLNMNHILLLCDWKCKWRLERKRYTTTRPAGPHVRHNMRFLPSHSHPQVAINYHRGGKKSTQVRDIKTESCLHHPPFSGRKKASWHSVQRAPRFVLAVHRSAWVRAWDFEARIVLFWSTDSTVTGGNRTLL